MSRAAAVPRPEPETAQPRIVTEKLSAMYGKFTAVKSVSLSFAPNRVHALIGPSGCGKSTFLRALNRMHELIPAARFGGAVGGTFGGGSGGGVPRMFSRIHTPRFTGDVRKF